ncbi:two-component system response regulator [Shewanella sp. GutDb-MelDb]|uniref:response regulator n=1 Tax=Shewanella sp. GutDb-MelDb TaxID=2058316 RepID=UPI000C7D54DF|nr:response regulator [Shewanella sp. GutDb-MelDb]PKG58959.1 response regulator [Shewanella sp. GutDb-MelDb]
MDKPKILIVDDDPICSSLLLSVLGDDYHVITINSGIHAIDLASNLQPNCIFLDIMMPEKNGYQVLKDLKSNNLTNLIPVIIISGLNEDSDEDLALRLGAQDYIFKPINPDDVYNKLKTHLK